MTSRTLLVSLLAIAAILISFSAQAIPVKWTLSGFSFDDGGTASGSFVYDADSNTYTDINMTTTAGTTLPGAAYAFQFTPPVAVGGLALTIDHTLDQTGLTALSCIPYTGGSLTNAGGVRTCGGMRGHSELTCLNSTCTSAGFPARFITAGTLTGVPVAPPSPPAPIPSLNGNSLMVLALLLMTMGVLYLRRRQS